MSVETLVDIIGWMGATLILIAYFTTSFKRFEISFKKYQVLNILGAVGMIVNGAYYGAFPSAFVNVIWGLFAITSLYNLKKSRMNDQTS